MRKPPNERSLAGALGRLPILPMDRATKRIAWRWMIGYLSLILALLCAYAIHAHRSGGEVADLYGPLLVALGLPWSWPSLHMANGGLALVILFAALAVNATLIFTLAGWLVRRRHRDRPT